MAHRGLRAICGLLLGALHCLVPALAFACRPCRGTNATEAYTTNSTHAESIVISTKECLKNIDPDKCHYQFPLIPTELETVSFTDGAIQDYIDVLAFASCMVYAIELASKGFGPRLVNVSNQPFICANLSDVLAHAKTTAQNITDIRGPLLHTMSPIAIRWASIITLSIALVVGLL
ncbi:GP4 [Lopma virus]|nr:GP4 [Lopma virus]